MINDSIALNGTYVTGDLTIDYRKYRVYLAGQDVNLTPNEYRIVALLGQHAGRVVTYKAMMLELWGPFASRDNKILRVHMANIRRGIFLRKRALVTGWRSRRRRFSYIKLPLLPGGCRVVLSGCMQMEPFHLPCPARGYAGRFRQKSSPDGELSLLTSIDMEAAAANIAALERKLWHKV